MDLSEIASDIMRLWASDRDLWVPYPATPRLQELLDAKLVRWRARGGSPSDWYVYGLTPKGRAYMALLNPPLYESKYALIVRDEGFPRERSER
jgi:hypothetical protein